MLDLGSAEAALRNGEWKAATVLAGSVIEALLYWLLGQETQASIAAAVASGAKTGGVPANLPVADLKDRAWMLHQYIEVAAEAKVITEGTADACRRAKEYRNLIHPAVADRRNIVSGRGSAHIAIGAAYEIIREKE